MALKKNLNADKDHEYKDTPVLSKVRIGETDYYLKDAEARKVIDTILNDYLTSADKTELLNADTALSNRIAVFEAGGAKDVGALQTLVNTINGEDTVSGSFRKAIKDAIAAEVDARDAAILVETNRAKAAEEALDARLDTIEGEGEGSIKKAVADEADARDAAIEAAIEALDVEDTAETGKYVSAVNEVDGKIVVSREALPAADQYTMVKQATPESQMAATYYLTKNGTQVGEKINIPKDQFLKEVKFYAKREDVPSGIVIPEEVTFPAIRFVFTTAAGDTETWVSVKDLVDTYTAGNGITIDNNVISAKAKVNDPYIEVTSDGIASKGIDDAIAAAVAAEAVLRKAADDDLDKAIKDEAARADAAEKVNAKAISDEVTRATGVEEGLDTRLTTAEGDIDALQADSHTHANKAELDKIANGDKEKWDKAVTDLASEIERATGKETELAGDIADVASDLAAEETRAKKAEGDLDTAYKAADAILDGKITDEATARENADDAINAKIGAKTDASTADTVYGTIKKEAEDRAAADAALGQRIDELDEQAFKDVTWTEMGRTLSKKIGDETTIVHSFGALADKDSATGTVEGQTISGVKANGTTTGELTGALGYASAEVSVSGKFTPEGTISSPAINLTSAEKEFATGLTGGKVAAFTEGTFTPNTPTVIDTSKFNGGSQASFTEGAFTAATLDYAESDEFVKEGLKAEVGTGLDAETLIFSAVTNKGKASVINGFTGGSKAADSFTANTVASLGTGFYTAGTAASKAADTFVANELQGVETGKVNNVTAAALANAPVFTGTQGDVAAAGNYDKANLGTVAFSGKAIELNVGDITVAAKTVTVE